MSEEPRHVGMIFGGWTVLALLGNRKHETRRIFEVPDIEGTELVEIRSMKRATVGFFRVPGIDKPVRIGYRVRAGDIIYAQEHWQTLSIYDEKKSQEIKDLLEGMRHPELLPRRFVADGTPVHWPDSDRRPMPIGRYRPPKTMPQLFARIFRRVRAVRFERLLQIDEKGAIAEGVIRTALDGHAPVFHVDPWPTSDCAESAVEMFEICWDRMHGRERPFEMNPWVAVSELEPIT